jgi:hypothetical protein
LAVIHALAVPAAAARLCRYLELRILLQQVRFESLRPRNVSAETLRAVRLDANAVRPCEYEEPVIRAREPKASFVHETVMEAAQGDQVVELCRAAVGPVLHVMPFREALAIATGKTTASVSRFRSTGKHRRNTARLAPDVERLAIVAFDDADDRSIARKPPSRVEC